ncbi:MULTISPECIES: bifunctional DNA primase/polymerase [unclassified Crossiella]|uniref:bifunctional DNA primase/polymerase n=1 Tax=unclassified Crossiella TaxID=2620835 RepID=UPI001FFED5C0|nr:MULTISPECIES: bifunctional DNA primase/polymerase [unclassified Crossiella]MCK2239373.1 bifunctional DNA primase/polymerase [Crossiella sp. S99.2]MCK2252068.1 bifunctional DNA primase/polymerase [Crossiella sp. S99.1]
MLAPAGTEVRSEEGRPIENALKNALRYAAYGWPVLPGTAWDGFRFRNPATGQPEDRLRPAVAKEQATTTAEIILRWWSDKAHVMPSVLLQTGDVFDVLSVDAPVARMAFERDTLQERCGPVLFSPWAGRTFFFVQPGTLVDPGARQNPGDLALLPSSSWVPVPPTRAHGVNAHWLVSPEVMQGQLADANTIREGLAGAMRAKGLRAWKNRQPITK